MQVSIYASKHSNIPFNGAADAPLAAVMDALNSITATVAQQSTVPGLVAPLAALARNTVGQIVVVCPRSFFCFRDSAGAAVPFRIISGTVTLTMYLSTNSPFYKNNVSRIFGLINTDGSTQAKSSFMTKQPGFALQGVSARNSAAFTVPLVEPGFNAAPNDSNIMVAFPTMTIQKGNSDLDQFVAAFAIPTFGPFAQGLINSLGLLWENCVIGSFSALKNMAVALNTGFNIDVTFQGVVDVTVPQLPNGSLTPTYFLMAEQETVDTAIAGGFDAYAGGAASAYKHSLLTGSFGVSPASQLACRISDLSQATFNPNVGYNFNIPGAGGFGASTFNYSTKMVVSPGNTQ